MCKDISIILWRVLLVWKVMVRSAWMASLWHNPARSGHVGRLEMLAQWSVKNSIQALIPGPGWGQCHRVGVRGFLDTIPEAWSQV